MPAFRVCDIASTFSSTYFKNGIVLCCSQAHNKLFQKPGMLLMGNKEPEQMSGDTASTNRKAGILSCYYLILFDLTHKTAYFYALSKSQPGMLP